MSLDVVDLREFYTSPLGLAVRRELRQRLGQIWPELRGRQMLALGYASPLLRPWLQAAEGLYALMPAAQGAVYWPREGPNIAALCDDHYLPLADEAVDRAVLLHALENANDPDQLLREVWRVLKGQGQALVIVPNRRGLWAGNDQTPFGSGRPYSSSQLKRLLREHGFVVERSWRSLYFPPSQARLNLALSERIERYAGWLFPGFGGVQIMEVTKQLYAPVTPRPAKIKHRLVLPLPLPMPQEPRPAAGFRP
jgi:SAM-dependent methyltransferase